MANDMRERLGKTAKSWMEARGKTPTSLSTETGISRQTIYRLLDAKGDSSLDTVVRIAEALGTTPINLLAGHLPGRDGKAPREVRGALPSTIRQELDALQDAVEGHQTALTAVHELLGAVRELLGRAQDHLPTSKKRGR